MNGRQQAAQLLRLRQLREDAARAALAQARAHEAACQAQVERRVAQIAAVRADRRALAGWLVDGGDAPRQQAYAAARRLALDDELERAEYDLIDERQALQRAQAAVAEARAAWQRAQVRREAIGQGVDGLRRALARTREQRAERELDSPAVEAR